MLSTSLPSNLKVKQHKEKTGFTSLKHLIKNCKKLCKEIRFHSVTCADSLLLFHLKNTT